MIKKILVTVIVCLVFYPCVSPAAPGPQDRRRIEEQKRESLKSTETRHQKIVAQQPVKKTPLQPDDIIYITEMSFRKVTYGYDLCKIIVILKGVENHYIGLDAQVAYLKEQNFLPKNAQDTFDPMKPLRRGLTAYVLRKVLNVRGGIFPRLFKGSERYALKEMTYEGVMSSGNIHEIISGDELSATITRAVNHEGAQ